MLDNIYFISLPPEQEKSIGNFKIDTNIKLPVETEDIENWSTEELSWEMIISAMLKIMAYAPDHEHINYYRDFIFAIRPNIINELSNSGVIKSKARDFELAEEIFLAIEGLAPGNERNSLNTVLLQEEKLNYLEAREEDISELSSTIEELYDNLLTRDKILTDTYFNAGYFYIKIRNFEKAEVCLNSFIDTSKDEAKIEKARSLLKEYKNIFENEDTFKTAYNEILNENEHLAINMLEDLTKSNNSIWNAWFLLGWAHRRVSNFSQALESLNMAHKLNKNESDILNEISICHMELGDYSSSKKALELALTLSPEDIKIVSNMGILEMKLGNKDKAKKFFETVLVLDPEDTIAKKYIENL